MQINDITSYLYSTQAANLQKTATTGQTANANQALDSETAESFASMLTNATNSYSQMNSLAAVLDKSVLGSVATTGTDLQALSEELLSTGSGREVIAQLAEGHLDAIAMSDGDEEDESTSITNALQETTTDTDTLNQILDKLNEIASNGASQK